MKNGFVKNIVSIIMVIAVIASVSALAGCGSSQVTVPDVTGMTQTDAEKTVSDAGLVLSVQREKYSDKTPEGSVESMITKAGEPAEKDSEVKVVLSLGEGRTVPNLSVLTGKEAANLLTKVDLNPIIVEEYSDEVEEGNVISYTDGGQVIAKGSDVTVTVSKGPET